MLRTTAVSLRISPFLLFQNDVKKRVGKKGAAGGQLRALAMREYRKLSKAEKAALNKRAKAVPNPALDSYNRFQKEYAHRFTHLNNKGRNRKVAALWHKLKTTGRVTIPAAGAEKKKVVYASVKLSKKSAKKQVKRAAKKKANKTKKAKKAKKPSKKAIKSSHSKKRAAPRKAASKSGKAKAHPKKRSDKMTKTRRARQMVNRHLRFLSAKDRKRVAAVLASRM